MMSLVPVSIHRDGRPLVKDGLRAQTLMSRMKGLLGTKNLGEGKGLIIPDCRQVHTFFMNYTIDVVFLDSTNTVLEVKTLAPWKISPWLLKAKSVLELPAGFAKKNTLKRGDKLEVHPS